MSAITKYMENVSVVHVVSDLVIGVSLLVYFHKRASRTEAGIEELVKHIETQNNVIGTLKRSMEDMGRALQGCIVELQHLKTQSVNQPEKREERTKKTKKNRKARHVSETNQQEPESPIQMHIPLPILDIFAGLPKNNPQKADRAKVEELDDNESMTESKIDEQIKKELNELEAN